MSAHGIPVPSLPRDLIRNLASQFSSKQLTKDVLPALDIATHEFFKNIASPHPPTRRLTFSMDLATFAKHAGRKAIEEGDVQMLLQRQRIVQVAGGGAKKSVFSVAQRYLPGELLGRVRMVKGGVKKRVKRVRRTEVLEEQEE